MFLPGIMDIDISQNITSSMETAFEVWKISYSGSIEVVRDRSPKGGIPIAKKMAWTWLGKFLQEKRKKFQEIIAFASNNRRVPVPPLPGTQKENPPADTYTQNYEWQQKYPLEKGDSGSTIYPLHISITDSLYSNVIQFTVVYVGHMTTTLMAKAVGLFEHVTVKGLTHKTWIEYIEATNADSIDSKSQQVVVLDLCHNLDGSSGTDVALPKQTNAKKGIGEPILAVTSPEEGKDWEDYKCRIRFIQDHKNIMSTKLHDATTDTQDALTAKMRESMDAEMDNKPFKGQDIELPKNVDNTEKRIQIKVYSPNPSLCYVELFGRAARFNNRINPPVLIGVGNGIGINPITGKGEILDATLGGALAHQYGEDEVIREVTRTGLKDDKGREVVLHTCAWKRRYVLDRKPDNGKIYTTGLPQRFKPEIIE
jgi:hypothetical protein